MLPQWIIEKKRDGASLTEEEIGFFVRGYAGGTIPDYQMAALTMAITLRGMTPEETVCLTRCMLESGIIIDTSSIPQPKIDKHSTGGIGDKVSLVLAPLVACCGVAVPMISGRGLGITGGTLDKLEAIPGYRTRLQEEEFIRIVRECGCAIAGASDRIAPADRKIYALRDVTGAVPSIPLIVSSILSKKMAAGLDGLVLDVKWGAGAFMKTLPEAKSLAGALIRVAGISGLRSTALISDMNQPLGQAVGNGLEVMEAVETLQGKGPADVLQLTLALGVKMLLLAGAAADENSARHTLLDKINSGQAFERFALMVRLHGGNSECLDRPDSLVRASIKQPVESRSTGYVQKIHAGLIGRASVALGAGRIKLADPVDHSVGIICLKKIGALVERGEPLAIIYAQAPERLTIAESLVKEAYRIEEKPAKPPRLIAGEIKED